jgi:hypothetical protein
MTFSPSHRIVLPSKSSITLNMSFHISCRRSSSKPFTYRTRFSQASAARYLCDQINTGRRPQSKNASPGHKFLAYDDNGFMHILYMEGGGRVMPATDMRKGRRKKVLGTEREEGLR